MVVSVLLKHHIKKMFGHGLIEIEKEKALFNRNYTESADRIKKGKEEMEKASKNRRLIQNR